MVLAVLETSEDPGYLKLPVIDRLALNCWDFNSDSKYHRGRGELLGGLCMSATTQLTKLILRL